MGRDSPLVPSLRYLGCRAGKMPRGAGPETRKPGWLARLSLYETGWSVFVVIGYQSVTISLSVGRFFESFSSAPCVFSHYRNYHFLPSGVTGPRAATSPAQGSPVHAAGRAERILPSRRGPPRPKLPWEKPRTHGPSGTPGATPPLRRNQSSRPAAGRSSALPTPSP